MKDRTIQAIIKNGVLLIGIAAGFIYLMTREPIIISQFDKYTILSRLINSAEYVFIFTGALIVMMISNRLTARKVRQQEAKKFADDREGETKKLIEKLEARAKKAEQKQIEAESTLHALEKEMAHRRIFMKTIAEATENYKRDRAGM